MPPLTTDRLILRAFSDADRDALALLAAPKLKPETPPGMPIGDDDYGVLN